MTTSGTTRAAQPVHVIHPDAASPCVLVCEHASNVIPSEYRGLGLEAADVSSHAAWDPGALPLATRLSEMLDARLVTGGVSRLVYDCNRPPEAPDAMPAQSERIAVPGNRNLTPAQRAQRTADVYTPFRSAVARTIASAPGAIVITIHSFTPIYMGRVRATEIGILHDSDSRLADSMLATARDHSNLRVARNEPYGPEDGVTHTLRVHALPGGYLNVMIEVRNDLIATPPEQDEMAGILAPWLTAAIAHATRARVSA